MLVDGKKIAADIRVRIREALELSGRALSLGVLCVGEDEVTRKFIDAKKKAAEEIGVAVVEKKVTEAETVEGLLEVLGDLVATTNGVVVQLPLPDHIDRKKVCASLPASHDVDCLGDAARDAFVRGESPLLPPVIAAIKEILARYSVTVSGKKVTIVGKGLLVGAPALVWFTNNGAQVANVDEHDDVASQTRDADIVVLGAGAPHLLQPGIMGVASVAH